jgi:hypothetical protein
MRRLPIFTGSGTLRALQCVASCVLPQADDKAGPAAQAGTTLHAYYRRAALVGRDAALAEVPLDAPGRDLCEALDIHAVPIDAMIALHEIAIAYDIATDTARFLRDAYGVAIENREYEKTVPPLVYSEIPMTLDALEYGGGDIIASDLKSGSEHAGYVEQVNLGLLAASRIYRDPTARLLGRLIYTRGHIRVDEWEASDGDLEALRSRLAATLSRFEELSGGPIGRDDVNPGEWCSYCRSKFVGCPEYANGAAELATMDQGALAKFRSMIVTDAGKAEAWKRLPVLEELVASMRQELDAAVIAGPVTMDDGSTLGAVRTERRKVVGGEIVRSMLAGEFGEDVANEAVKVTTEYATTIGAIEKAAGKRKAVVIEALEMVGAITTSTSVKAGIVKTKKGKAA